MRNSNITYPNLRAEMSRKNIGMCELAEKLNMNRDTLARNLSGKSAVSLELAFNIQQIICPNVDVKDLFSKEK